MRSFFRQRNAIHLRSAVKWHNLNPLTRCYAVTSAILASGFSCALVIYLTSGEAPENPFAEYENSKRFAHEVERMGGKTAIIANDLSKWFAGLWHGEKLSYTVAVITIVIAAVYYFVATGLAVDEDRKDSDG